MASVSYQISLGQTLESMTVGTNAPAAGSGAIELRIDQTTTAITDANAPGGTRAIKRGEVFALLKILEQYLVRDTSLNE